MIHCITDARRGGICSATSSVSPQSCHQFYNPPVTATLCISLSSVVILLTSYTNAETLFSVQEGTP
ncbi:hypothetical protein CY34DRAFT_810414 [Suillus luteus UH-Slu-Lm8-n1]|uniref:Uncharacterized protein n=1 Tax=Suillus luteus UH-Slu-Lm8-n1 TaxID=930992 RepID=A0A0D0ASV8_9AGAM|nr:hypothetical protein CY34DRAFT_810414 [Suillus luteus UH-Slu-Lm8-n1]